MKGNFYYDEDSNILVVGFVSGKIYIYIKFLLKKIIDILIL